MPEPTASLSHLSSLPRLNLALQGGGSHGALTWGVLDALLEDGQWQFDGWLKSDCYRRCYQHRR